MHKLPTPITPRPCPRRLHARLCLLAACVPLLGLIATAATAVPATADGTPVTVTTTLTDHDDTAGRLDVARVRHRLTVFGPDHARVSYTVTTHDAFRATRLSPRWRNFVLELNRDGERGSERNVRVSARSGRLVAEVISNATRETLATVTANRVDGRTFTIVGPRELIGARSYFWVSTFHASWSARCNRGPGFPITCQDSVPDSGWIRMDRWAWPAVP